MQNDFLTAGGYYDVKQAFLGRGDGARSAAELTTLSQLYTLPPRTDQIRRGYESFVGIVYLVAKTALASGLRTVFVCAAYDRFSAVRPPLFNHDPERRDHGCHTGTWGAEVVAQLRPLTAHPHASVVTKLSFDAFFATDLCDVLRAGMITTVYLTGVETNVCVLFTAVSALSNGFDTVIVEDAVATSQPHLHRPALDILEIAKARRMGSAEFILGLKG